MSSELAVAFAKPHVAQCQELLWKFSDLCKILGLRILTTRKVELGADLLYRTYLPHAFFALDPIPKHLPYLEAHAHDVIERATGLSLREHLLRKSMQSAGEAMQSLSLSPSELYDCWESSNKFSRVRVGYQIKLIYSAIGKPLWVVNGYFPYRFGLYQRQSTLVPAWLLEIPAGESVASVRLKLIGDICGPLDSIRGYLAKHHERLGVEVDAFNNGFHMSDSEAASVRETAVWFPGWLRRQPLVQSVAKGAKIPLEALASVISSLDASLKLSSTTIQTDTAIFALSELVEKLPRS